MVRASAVYSLQVISNKTEDRSSNEKAKDIVLTGIGEVDDEFGLEITEWTGEWKTVHYGLYAECQEQDQRLIEELERPSAE